MSEPRSEFAAAWRDRHPPVGQHTDRALAEVLAENERLREALRRACVDGFADPEGAMHSYLRGAESGSREADRG